MTTLDSHLDIGGRPVGPGHPVFVVAEISANHQQEYERAESLVRGAAQAGAEAVKLQTYTPDTLTIDSEADAFRHGDDSPWAGRTLYDLYQEAYMPWEWQPRLQEVAAEVGLQLFSSAFDPTAVEFLEELDVPAYKVASFELVDLPLIRRIAQTGKPLILSTGMATLEEIQEAVRTAEEGGARQVALLKCTSAYPAPPEEVNLRTIPDLADRLGVPVGLSDHTLGAEVPVAAVALGACIVEKHFTLSREAAGPDAAFSMEPAEFQRMVEAVRTTERALGGVRYEPMPREAASRGFRRSLFVVEDVAAGEPLTERNVRSIRPGSGLHPRHYEAVLGRTAARDIARGTPLSWDLLERGDEA